MTLEIRNRLTFCSPNDAGCRNPCVLSEIALLPQIDTLYLQLFPLSIHCLLKHERSDELWKKYIQTVWRYIQIQHSNCFRIHIPERLKKKLYYWQFKANKNRKISQRFISTFLIGKYIFWVLWIRRIKVFVWFTVTIGSTAMPSMFANLKHLEKIDELCRAGLVRNGRISVIIS